MTGTVELKTKRLTLRRHRIEDAEVLYSSFGCDPKMYEYSGWNPYQTLEMAKDSINRFMASYKDPDFYGWAIEFESRLVGTIGAYDYDPSLNQLEIGLSIERPSWGKGFATEALSCVLDYLTVNEKISVVTAWCASDNVGSMKALQKAGMKQTGIEKGSLEISGKSYDKLLFSYQIRIPFV